MSKPIRQNKYLDEQNLVNLKEEISKGKKKIKDLKNKLTKLNYNSFKDLSITAFDLKKAGYKNNDILFVGYTADEITIANTEFKKYIKSIVNESKSIKELKEKNPGFKINNLIEAGINLKYLKNKGYSLEDIINLEYPLKDIINARVTINELLTSGYTTKNTPRGFQKKNLKKELDRLKIKANYLREKGYSLEDIKKAKYSLKDIITAGYKINELRKVGFNNTNIKNANKELHNNTRKLTVPS